MIKKLFMFLGAHKVVTIGIVAIVIGGVYMVQQNSSESTGQVQYTTQSAEKGTLVTSVSGTGQVSASNQITVNPATSGKLSAIHVSNGQAVTKGELLFSLDARDAARAVTDAEISLESARVDLEELKAGADAQDILKAENALAQAERNLEKAQKEYETIESDADQIIADAYEDGYNNVSSTFFKLSDYMNDLQDVLGTDDDPETYADAYKNILGEDSTLVQRLLDDYDTADALYQDSYEYFRGTYKNDSKSTIYKLMSDTIDTGEAVSRALESARHMYDEIESAGYVKYDISSTISTMQPQVESDLSGVFSAITSLQNTKDTIDDTVESTPDDVKDAKIAFDAAVETVSEKKLALQELRDGADALDLRTQENIVAQKEASLANAREDLADHYVRASFDGVVEEIDAEIGDNVSSGTALATLITTDRVAEIVLNEVDVAQVKVGQKATVSFDAVEGVTGTGEVVEVDSLGTVSQGVVSYDVVIAFDIQDDRIKPGMTVSVDIITEVKTGTIIVPSSAVKIQGTGYYVEILEDNSPVKKTVETGLSNDTMTEIVSGIEEGTDVIVQTTTATGTSSSSGGSSILPTGPGGGGGMRP